MNRFLINSFIPRSAGFCVAIALYGCASASDDGVEALLSSMRKAYASVKSAKFSTLVYATLHPLDCTNYYLSPSSFRVDVKDIYGEVPPRDGTYVTDGTTTYATTAVSDNRTEHFPYTIQDFYNLVPGNVESFSFFAGSETLSTAKGKWFDKCNLRILPDQKWDGRSWTVLEDSNPNDNSLFKFYIDPKTYFIWRTTGQRDGKDVVDTRVKSMKLDVDVPAGLFRHGS